jgi:hypothetical protein
VVTPAARQSVPAHPWVNVIVRFGTAANGAVVDPSTFHARLGHKDVTELFDDFVENGVVVGKRAALRNGIVAAKKSARNVVRFKVRSLPFRGKKRLRDTDHVRFAAFTADNQPPNARANITSDVVLPDVLTQLDGSQSDDPEKDELKYHWDFGDGTPTSDEQSPAHRFPDLSGNLTVRLTVDDGQAQDEAQLQVFECPDICDGCTRGQISVDVPAPLEFNAVAAGTSATANFTVTNTDTTPTSQLHVRLGSGAFPASGSNAAFSVTPTDVTLGPGEHTDVTVTYAPDLGGHQGAVLPVVSCAANERICIRGSLTGRLCTSDANCGASEADTPGACGGYRIERLMAHGYGGTAPGRGPTLAAETLFYVSSEVVNGEVPVYGILPSGAQFKVDNRLRSCGGQFPFDICMKDSDCLGGGGCQTSGTCTRGDNAGQPCTYNSECPGGTCSAQQTLDPTDMCSDGSGTLYLINEDSATDPDTFDSKGTVARIQMDPQTGERLAADVLYHPGEESTLLGCDGLAAGARGRLYVPEYHELEDEPPGCQRDEREALDSISKGTGAVSVPPGFGDIDGAAGYPECEVFENVEDIHASRDGGAVFVALPLTGITRILPKPALTMVPDYYGTFEVHPDGSIVFVIPEDQGTTGLLKVYKVSVGQAQQGALAVNELVPCVTVEVPNGGGRTALGELAVGRAQTGSDDATIVVTFTSVFPSDSQPPVSNPKAFPRGTIAIASPARSDTCSTLGLLNLERLTLDQMTF